MGLTAELNRTRRLGCEFEMTVPLVGAGSGHDIQETIARVLTSNGLTARSRGYTHAPVPSGIDVCVEHDSSVRGESRYEGVTWHSVEVKTRILDGVADWERIVPPMLNICRYLGARCNRSTGHHLHIEVPEIAVNPRILRSIYVLHRKFEHVIYGLVPPSRRQNGYARPLPDVPGMLRCRSRRCFDTAISRYFQRHHALNLTHIPSGSNRIEYRWHSGTLDPAKARHWMRFCNRMIEHAVTRSCQASESLPNDRKSLERLLVSTGLKVNAGIYSSVSPELREAGKYLLKRWKSFHGNVALRPRFSSNNGTAANQDEES